MDLHCLEMGFRSVYKHSPIISSAPTIQKADIKDMCEVSNISGESRLVKNFIEASRVYYLQLQVIVIDAKVRFKVTLHSKSTFYSISYQVLHKSQC